MANKAGLVIRFIGKPSINSYVNFSYDGDDFIERAVNNRTGSNTFTVNATLPLTLDEIASNYHFALTNDYSLPNYDFLALLSYNSPEIIITAKSYGKGNFSPNPNPAVEFEVINEVPLTPPPTQMSITGMTIVPAATNEQTRVRYVLELENPQFPLNIISPVAKNVNNASELWIEWYRFPSLPDFVSIQNDGDALLPRVDLFEVGTINKTPVTSNTGDITINVDITEADYQYGVRFNTLEYSLDNGTWIQKTTPPLTSHTYTNINSGQHNIRVRDNFGRVVTKTFDVDFTPPTTTISFKILGDKPPFRIDLCKSSDKRTIIDGITVVSSGNTVSFNNKDPNENYTMFITDSVNNRIEREINTNI